MTSPATSTDWGDQALVHHYIRVFGRRPTADDLVRYQRARSRLSLGFPARARRRAAQLIVRL